MQISVFDDNNARDTRRINTNKMAKASLFNLIVISVCHGS